MGPASTSAAQETGIDALAINLSLDTKLWKLLFRVDHAHRYYLSRESFFFRMERLGLILITIGSLFSAFNIASAFFSIACFLIATLLIVIDPAKLAGEHKNLRDKFAAMLVDVETHYERGNINKHEYIALQESHLRLTKEEGREYYRVVEASCRNDAIRSRGCDPSCLLHISAWRHALMHIMPFSGFDPK